MTNETDWKKKVLDFEIRGLEPKPIAISDLHKSIKTEMRQLLKEWYGPDFVDRHEIELFIASGLKNVKDRNIYKYNWMFWVWAFYCDDEIEINKGLVTKWTEKVNAMHSDDDKPLDLMFNYFMDGFKSYLPKDIMQKQMDDIQILIDIHFRLIVCLDDKSEVDINEYLNTRLVDVYAGKGFTFLELVLSTNMVNFRKDTKINETLEKFDRNCALLAVLSNDLYSFKKEVKQNLMKYNYIYLLMKRDGITAQEAADAMVVDIKEYNRLMYSFGSELKRLEIQAISEYVDLVIDVLEGTLYWSSVSARYNDLSLYE